MNNMLPSLVVRNNDIHHCNTRQNHHLRSSRPTCKTVVNSFTNRSFQIAISSKVNINVSSYKFKYNVTLFLLENKLMITYHY